MKHPATDQAAIHRVLTHLVSRGWRIAGVSDRTSFPERHDCSHRWHPATADHYGDAVCNCSNPYCQV